MAFRIKPKSDSDKKNIVKPKIVGEIRKSQTITTYGPGSLVDFPRMSAIIDGIDNWESSLGKFNFDKMKIHERNLEKILGKKFFIQPQMIDDKMFVNGINARRFPEYCYCPECGALIFCYDSKVEVWDNYKQFHFWSIGPEADSNKSNFNKIDSKSSVIP